MGREYRKVVAPPDREAVRAVVALERRSPARRAKTRGLWRFQKPKPGPDRRAWTMSQNQAHAASPLPVVAVQARVLVCRPVWGGVGVQVLELKATS